MINYFIVNNNNGAYEVRYFSTYANKELVIEQPEADLTDIITNTINILETVQMPEEQVGMLKEEVLQIKQAKEEIENNLTKYVGVLLETELTEEQMLELIEIFPGWDPNEISYAVEDRVKFEGKLYKVIQEHTSQANWTPAAAPALFVEVAPPEVVPEFVQPTGAHDSYPAGAKVIFEGKVYESLIDGNAHSPLAAPQNWTLIEETIEETPPEEESVPDWIQPTGGHDVYAIGDKVLYNGKVYESLIAGNTYSPTGYPQGWQIIE